MISICCVFQNHLYVIHVFVSLVATSQELHAYVTSFQNHVYVIHVYVSIVAISRELHAHATS